MYFTIGSVRSPPHTLWGREPQSLIVVGLRKRILRILGTNYSFLRASQNRECRPMRLSWSSGQPSPRLLTAFTVLSRSRPPNPARLHRVWAGGKTFTLQERAGKKFSLSAFCKVLSLSSHFAIWHTDPGTTRTTRSLLSSPSVLRSRPEVWSAVSADCCELLCATCCVRTSTSAVPRSAFRLHVVRTRQPSSTCCRLPRRTAAVLELRATDELMERTVRSCRVTVPCGACWVARRVCLSPLLLLHVQHECLVPRACVLPLSVTAARSSTCRVRVTRSCPCRPTCQSPLLARACASEGLLRPSVTAARSSTCRVSAHSFQSSVHPAC